MIRQTPRTKEVLRLLKSQEPYGLTVAALAFWVGAPIPAMRRLLNSLLHQGAPVARQTPLPSGEIPWCYDYHQAALLANSGAELGL